MSWHVVSSI